MTHFDWLDRAITIHHIHTIPTFRRLFIVIKNKNGGNIEIVLKIIAIIFPKIIAIIFPGNYNYQDNVFGKLRIMAIFFLNYHDSYLATSWHFWALTHIKAR